MMNRNGFTLLEMLACLALLGIILLIGLYLSRDTLATTLTQMNRISDNEIFDSAEVYVISSNVKWNDGYTCVTVEELVDKGYFDSDEVESLTNKIIRLKRNETTKVIISREYVSQCN